MHSKCRDEKKMEIITSTARLSFNATGYCLSDVGHHLYSAFDPRFIFSESVILSFTIACFISFTLINNSWKRGWGGKTSDFLITLKHFEYLRRSLGFSFSFCMLLSFLMSKVNSSISRNSNVLINEGYTFSNII